MDDYQPMTAPDQEASPPPAASAEAPQRTAALADPQAAQRFFSDPRAMYEVAKMAAQNRQGDTLKWLAMGHRAVQENAIEATQHLLAGDGDAAVAAFNKSGRFNDATSATKNDDGTWTLARKNGQRMTVDPNKIMRSFLSPKDFADAEHHDATARVQQQNADTQAQHTENQRRYQEGVLEHYERSDESRAQLRDSLAENARARFAHELEKAGIKQQHAVELATLRAELKGNPQAMTDPTAPTKLRQKLLENGPLAQQYADDPVKLAGVVDFTVRDTFTQILPRRDGKGLDVVTTVGGEPVILGNYANAEEARAAKDAFVTGKNAPTKGAAPAASGGKATQPRALSKQGSAESWAADQNDATLTAVANTNGPYAPAARAELERRKTAPKQTPAEEQPIPPRTFLPNVPRSLPAR